MKRISFYLAALLMMGEMVMAQGSAQEAVRIWTRKHVPNA